MIRRLVAVAAVAAAAFGVTAPASAAYTCVGGEKAGVPVGACAGSWCPDVCFIVAWTYCHDLNPKICAPIDGLGAPPGH